MINTDLNKAGTKLFSGCTLNVWVKLDTIWPQWKENHSWIMALVVEKTFLPFFQTFFFLGLENCWEISRLFQEFKTLYKPTLSLILYQVESPMCGPVLALSLKLELNLYSESSSNYQKCPEWNRTYPSENRKLSRRHTC